MNGVSNIHKLKALGYRAIMLANWRRDNLHPKLTNEAARADDVIFQSSSVFPFTLFPDTIAIDRVKVTITRRFFFSTARMTSISHEDLMSVEGTVGPFLGSLKLWSQVFTERAAEVTKPLVINYLTRGNALHTERLLQGCIIAKHKNVDMSNVPQPELKTLLLSLGGESRVN